MEENRSIDRRIDRPIVFSNRIINKMREVTQNNFQEMNSLNPDLSTDDRNPLVLVAYKVSKIEISDVIEPEPLP